MLWLKEREEFDKWFWNSFTQLRREVRGRGIRRRMSVSGLVSQDINVRPELASVKSRRLAVHMSRRPAVIAALNGALDGRVRAKCIYSICISERSTILALNVKTSRGVRFLHLSAIEVKEFKCRK